VHATTSDHGRSFGASGRPGPAWQRTPYRRRLPVALFAVLAALALVSVACGSDDETTTSPDATVAPATTADPIEEEPCLPPACGTTVPFTEGDGYAGPQYETPASGAAVDGASVVSSTGGNWWAQGLVVNGTEPLNETPLVRAELVAADGSVLERVVGAALVGPLRPGEPSPFRLGSTTVDTAQVANVRWSVLVGGGETTESGRQLQLNVFWTRPAGGQPVDVAGYADAGGAGSPLLVYVSVTNNGDVAIADPEVVAAWVDGRGRVFAVTSAPVQAPGTSSPAATLAPGAQADALIRLAPPLADSLGDRVPILWSIGR
jgi:hypothetical protein